jgi:hypothetical protein
MRNLNETNGSEITPEIFLEDLKAQVRAVFSDIDDDSLLISIYFYCEDHYIGPFSFEYQVMCLIDFHYRGSRKDIMNDNSFILDAYEVLTANRAKQIKL